MTLQFGRQLHQVMCRSFLTARVLSGSGPRSVKICRKCLQCEQNRHRGHFIMSSKTNIITPNRSLSGSMEKKRDYIFRQLLEYKSFTYTYILADPETKEAIIIDPVYEMVERDIRIIKELGLNLKYAVNTHVHADHVTGSGKMKELIPSCKSMISEASKAKGDIKLSEGDMIEFGPYKIEVKNTPGHTNGCLTFVWHDKGMAFTGDTLLIRGCGRTDFQEGNSGTLYESVHKKIFSLPDDYRLFPAHDYTGQTETTVVEERKMNPRLTKAKEEFVKIMDELHLPYPKQIDRAVPANMVCGLQDPVN